MIGYRRSEIYDTKEDRQKFMPTYLNVSEEDGNELVFVTEGEGYVRVMLTAKGTSTNIQTTTVLCDKDVKDLMVWLQDQEITV